METLNKNFKTIAGFLIFALSTLYFAFMRQKNGLKILIGSFVVLS